MTHRLRLAAFLIAALPLAGCGNKGPLTLQPQGESPPPTASAVATDAHAGAQSVMAPAATSVVAPAAVSGPPDPTGSSQTIAPPTASTVTPPPADDADDGTTGTPR